MGFKFTSTPTLPAASPASAHPRWRRWAIIGTAVFLVWFFFGSLLNLFQSRTRPALPDTGPVLLAIKQQGELHTVKLEQKDVLHFETDRQPEGWVANIPGADGLVRWATHNQALVIATGTVEAGIDLSQLTPESVTRIALPDGKTRLRVQLPSVTVYPPNVKVRVESSSRGPFWKDENLIPKAQEEAGRRFLKAAEEANIREIAQKNAEAPLKNLLRPLGFDDVEFVFNKPETVRSGTARLP